MTPENKLIAKFLCFLKFADAAQQLAHSLFPDWLKATFHPLLQEAISVLLATPQKPSDDDFFEPEQIYLFTVLMIKYKLNYLSSAFAKDSAAPLPTR